MEIRKFIENIEFEVSNKASISKDISFYILKIFEKKKKKKKMIFKIMFETIKKVRQLQLRRQTFPKHWR